MATPAEWTEADVRAVADALEYHGRLSDRIVDDLADSLRRSPQAIRSKVRQIRAKERPKQPTSAPTLPDTPDAALPSPEDATIAETQPIAKSARPTSNKVRSPKLSAPPPYTQLVTAIAELELLADNAAKARLRLETATKEAGTAEAALRKQHSVLVAAFPEAKALLDKALATQMS